MDALQELRVVEIGEDVASEYATKLLADLGADVVKVEPVRGDALRSFGPFPEDRPDPERSGLFRYLNANKRSLATDLATAAGAADVLRLLRDADLLVTSVPPGWLDAHGLGRDVLRREGRQLAIVEISPFGQSGPYRDLATTDLVTQAAGGWVSSHGLPSAKPVQVGGRIPEYLTAVFAAAAALTAVRAARERCEIVAVDVCAMECLVGTLPYPMLWAQTLLKLGMPPPQKRRTPIPGALRCRDGWVGVNALTAQNWADCCTLFEVPEFIPNQNDIQSGRPVEAEFYAKIQPWLDEHTVEEIVTLGQAFRIPTISVGNGETLTRLPQLLERPFFTTDPELGFLQPSFPYRLSRTPARLRLPPPKLGQHGDAIRRSPWPERTAPAATSKPASAGSADLPFRGLRVLDLGTFWAGPYVGMYLASLGADVIKIESIQRPDGMRFVNALKRKDFYECGAIFHGANPGKRGVTVKLDSPEGFALLERLIAGADVVVENYSVRVLENLGLDPERLLAEHRRLILMRMPSWGLDGPWRDRVGWAMNVEQASGLAWLSGYEDLPLVVNLCDAIGGLHAFLALSLALEHRRRTGEGQLVEVPLVEPGLNLAAEQVIEHSAYGRTLTREGNRGPYAAPQGVYRCGGENAFLALAVTNDAQWRGLRSVLGDPAWSREPGFETHAGRRAAQDRLDAELSSWCSARDRDETVAALLAAGVPAHPLANAHFVMPNPQLEHRGFYQELEHPVIGPRRYPGLPMRFSALGPDWHRRPPPTLGQHNREVLGGELGLSDEELVSLAERKIIGTKPSFVS